MSTLVDLVEMIEKPEVLHNINTKLFFVLFPQVRALQELALESTNFYYSSSEYRVTVSILDITNCRLFRSMISEVPAEKPNNFMKIKFLNKVEERHQPSSTPTINIVSDRIPVYFKDKRPPTVSYEYIHTVASKLFNFASTLSNLNTFYIYLSLGFVNTFIWMLVVMCVMHEDEDPYSIQGTWSCYWLDQFHTLALNTWNLSTFFPLYWIGLWFIFLIALGVELPFVYSCHSFPEYYNLFSVVRLSIRTFCFIIIDAPRSDIQANPVCINDKNWNFVSTCHHSWLSSSRYISLPLPPPPPPPNGRKPGSLLSTPDIGYPLSSKSIF